MFGVGGDRHHDRDSSEIHRFDHYDSNVSEMTELRNDHHHYHKHDDSEDSSSHFFQDDGFPSEVISIDDAIDRLGMGTFQKRIMLAAGLCFAADAMEILLLSFLSLVLMDEWQLSNRQASSIA